ncbi:MAG: hypothetical protein JWM54_500, partial [Acidobacteriaceae bacterium]|nr:hypothetical protein [Acidobacteriaceae bacterium]
MRAAIEHSSRSTVYATHALRCAGDRVCGVGSPRFVRNMIGLT